MLNATSSGTTCCASSLMDIGNIRPAMHRKAMSSTLSVDMLTAKCQAVHIHSKMPIETLRPNQVYFHKASLLYAAKPHFGSRTCVGSLSSKHSPSHLISKHGGASSPKAKHRVSTYEDVSTGDSSSVLRKTTVDGTNADLKKVTKVFLSEKQSSCLKECGILVPCAPPCTPTPGKQVLPLNVLLC